MSDVVDAAAVKAYLLELQARIVAGLEQFDGKPFRSDSWERPAGGGGISRLIEDGDFFERGGCNFSHVMVRGCRHRQPPAGPNSPARASRRWASRSSSIRAIPTARRRT